VRLIKVFGLAAVAGVAAMAFVGASSAMALEHTLLCKNHNSATSCSEVPTSIHIVASNPTLLSSLGNITCESSLGTGTPGASGAPQVITITSLTWTNCELGGEPCTVTTPTLGAVNVLKTALNLGTLELSKTVIKVVCGSFVSCKYEPNAEQILTVEGALHNVGTGHGMVTANGLDVHKVGSGFCPSSAEWDALYEPLEHVYIVA
jgi:hypothetical protein